MPNYYYSPLRKAKGLQKLRMGNLCPHSAMIATLSVRETCQINPFQEHGNAWSSHTRSDRSTVKLLIYPGARSEPRGKKVYIYIYILAYTKKETVRKTHYWLVFPFKEQWHLEVETLADNYEKFNFFFKKKVHKSY